MASSIHIMTSCHGNIFSELWVLCVGNPSIIHGLHMQGNSKAQLWSHQPEQALVPTVELDVIWHHRDIRFPNLAINACRYPCIQWCPALGSSDDLKFHWHILHESHFFCWHDDWISPLWIGIGQSKWLTNLTKSLWQFECYHMFVVVNFDALAEASDFRIKRRQVVFLCWMQDSNPGSLERNLQQTECPLTNRLSCRGSS